MLSGSLQLQYLFQDTALRNKLCGGIAIHGALQHLHSIFIDRQNQFQYFHVCIFPASYTKNNAAVSTYPGHPSLYIERT